MRLRIVVHGSWVNGIASSIRAGIGSLIAIAPDVDGGLLMVAEQPFVGLTNLMKLVQACRASTAAFVAAEYEGTLGVPAIFDRTQLKSNAPRSVAPTSTFGSSMAG